jgi:hypothetical protein
MYLSHHNVASTVNETCCVSRHHQSQDLEALETQHGRSASHNILVTRQVPESASIPSSGFLVIMTMEIKELNILLRYVQGQKKCKMI